MPFAFLNIFKLIPWWIWPMLALAGWGWMGHHKARVLKAELDTQILQMQAAQTKAAQLLAKALGDLREREAANQKLKDGADAKLRKEQTLNASRLATERLIDSVRIQQLSDFAAGSRAADADSVAACRERATALGGVLGEALRTSAECAGAAEDLAGGVRALREAWPK